jgi:hypothetical protein
VYKYVHTFTFFFHFIGLPVQQDIMTLVCNLMITYSKPLLRFLDVFYFTELADSGLNIHVLSPYVLFLILSCY